MLGERAKIKHQGADNSQDGPQGGTWSLAEIGGARGTGGINLLPRGRGNRIGRLTFHPARGALAIGLSLFMLVGLGAVIKYRPHWLTGPGAAGPAAAVANYQVRPVWQGDFDPGSAMLWSADGGTLFVLPAAHDVRVYQVPAAGSATGGAGAGSATPGGAGSVGGALPGAAGFPGGPWQANRDPSRPWGISAYGGSIRLWLGSGVADNWVIAPPAAVPQGGRVLAAPVDRGAEQPLMVYAVPITQATAPGWVGTLLVWRGGGQAVASVTLEDAFPLALAAAAIPTPAPGPGTATPARRGNVSQASQAGLVALAEAVINGGNLVGRVTVFRRPGEVGWRRSFTDELPHRVAVSRRGQAVVVATPHRLEAFGLGGAPVWSLGQKDGIIDLAWGEDETVYVLVGGGAGADAAARGGSRLLALDPATGRVLYRRALQRKASYLLPLPGAGVAAVSPTGVEAVTSRQGRAWSAGLPGGAAAGLCVAVSPTGGNVALMNQAGHLALFAVLPAGSR